MTFAHEFSRYHIKSKTSPKNFYRLQVFVSIHHLLLNLSEQTQQTTGDIITNTHKSRITKYCHFVIFPSYFLNKIATNLKITFYFLQLFLFLRHLHHNFTLISFNIQFYIFTTYKHQIMYGIDLPVLFHIDAINNCPYFSVHLFCYYIVFHFDRN